MTFGEEVGKLRQKLFLSQADMAKELGVSLLMVNFGNKGIMASHHSKLRRLLINCAKSMG